MTDVTLSKAVRSSLLNLQDTAATLAKSQERLATGLKVNSALDNPTNFFTASALSSRAGDLGSLLDSVGNSVQTLEAADNGLTAITKLVESAQATARQALQTSATVDQTTTTVDSVASATGTVDVGADTTATATGATGLTGTDNAVTVAAAGESLTINVDGTAVIFDFYDGNAGAYGGANVGIDVQTTAAVDIDTALADIQTGLRANGGAGAASATVALNAGTVEITLGTDTDSNFVVTDGSTGLGLTDGTYNAQNAVIGALSGTLTVESGGTTETLTFGAGNIENRADLEAALGTTATNLGITAEVDANGFLNFAGATASADSITIGGTLDVATDFGITEQAYDAATTATTTSVANPQRDVYVSQYNETLSQIDELAEDAGFNGVNLLNGDDLSVLFNEDGSSNLDITGVTFNAAGLSLSTVATGGFDTNTNVNTELDSLSAAIDTLRTQASTFGSNLSIVETREAFTKSTINTLETGAANLTLADANEEAANVLALQTRQSLSSTALSLSAQADQAVLRLL
jgi:flagellin